MLIDVFKCVQVPGIIRPATATADNDSIVIRGAQTTSIRPGPSH